MQTKILQIYAREGLPSRATVNHTSGVTVPVYMPDGNHLTLRVQVYEGDKDPLSDTRPMVGETFLNALEIEDRASPETLA